MNPAAFFAKYAPAAQRTCRGTGLLPSVTLAQAALESNWGESGLSKYHNNFGGIKAGRYWRGATVTLPTTEEIKGKLVKTTAAFRKYPTADAYFADRIQLFRSLSRYASLLRVDTYKAEAMLFTQTGYCTDTHYGPKLIAIIEQHGLTKYDV
jgi:flagellum-specific peptidoglycan hydrolase FlgJ